MTRKTDYQMRKDTILGIVVSSYIKNVTTVSSGLIAGEFLPELSSATIRNILAELEEEGFLSHPHTSAGRIPTQEGYRYYVDYLMSEIRLLEEEKERIRREYARQMATLEDLFEKTSQILSDVTHYTSIVSVDGVNSRMFCRGTNYIVSYPDYQDIQRIQDILLALEKKEQLMEILNRELEHRIKIYIGHELACRSIDEVCSLAVCRYQTRQGTSGRVAVLGPTRMDYSKVVSTLGYVTQVMEELIA